MTKYTPGPWQSDCTGNITAQNSQISIGCAYNIAWPCGIVPEDYLANARLMAAAPELLAALKACDEAMGYMSKYDIPLTLPKQVKDAIAKYEELK